MPRSAQRDMVIEHKKSDGSIIRARLERRKEGTYAIDLRKLGGGRPTLKPAGSTDGTKDLTVARQLGLRELAALAGGMVVGTPTALRGPQTQLETYLDRKARGGKMTEHTKKAAYTCIIRCWAILHEQAGVMSWGKVTRQHIGPMVDALSTREFGGKTLSTNSVLKHLNYLKGFFRHAVDEGITLASPIHRHTAVPERDSSFVRDWLEPEEMGLLLETSFAGRPGYPHNACHAWPEILTTEAYTGAREDEVLGLAVADVHFTGGTRGCGTIRFHDNKWRTLKNPESARTFSMWPAHSEILQAYTKREKPPRGGLLFPRPDGRMWGELRESMDRDLKAAGIEKNITDHSLRHGYISHRARMYVQHVQGKKIVERGVHIKDIAAEVGHGSDRMTREVYEHDSERPVEGWTELNYATALAVFRKGLRKPSGGRTASKRAARSSSKRSPAGKGR